MREIKLLLAEGRCKGCELCVQACRRAVLSIGTSVNALGYSTAAIVDPNRCTGCMACAMVCPETAFTIYQVV